ncbi:hypothetical protein KAR91_79570 [Candidatus Pacearchaeota archaeon]|nr:hypothetical protein [Candidatus Pacearchaeota archaeon]
MIDLQQFTAFVNQPLRWTGRGQKIYEIKMHPNDWAEIRETINNLYGNTAYRHGDPYGHGAAYNQLMGQNIQIDSSIAIGTIGVYPHPPTIVQMGTGPSLAPPKKPKVSMSEVCDSMLKNLTEEETDSKPLSNLSVANFPTPALRRD